MTVKKAFDSEALQYTYNKYIGNDPEQIAAYGQESANIDVAKLIYNLRTKEGLSQRSLRKKVDTSASVICRLEDADYEGHSLSMLKRITAALGRRLEIRTVPITKRASTEPAKIRPGRRSRDPHRN
jgi:ribosome-binding protein aMBF1 (putative translation factor)